MQGTFQEALQSGLSYIESYPKSDLHTHAGRGGNIKYLTEWLGKKISLPNSKFHSLKEMQEWFQDHVVNLSPTADWRLKRWEASFHQAYADHISVLSISFSPSGIAFAGGMDSFIELMTKFNKISPNTVFLPELTYDRACNVDNALNEIDSILSYHYFKSIDISNNEFAQPIKNFKPLYRKAKEYGIRLKAHVGEFGTAEDVMEAVEELELDEVHHGIAAAQSNFVMNWLARNHIQLNICPTSNVVLNVVDNYKNHPIRLLYYAGIPVTVNTDDLAIFNQSVSQEYFNIYVSGLLNADELNEIRLTGLNEVQYYS